MISSKVLTLFQGAHLNVSIFESFRRLKGGDQLASLSDGLASADFALPLSDLPLFKKPPPSPAGNAGLRSSPGRAGGAGWCNSWREPTTNKS